VVVGTKERSHETLRHLAAPGSLAHSLALRFEAEGEELFLVGGAVRDALFEIDASEPNLDFATSAVPDTTFRILSSFASARPFRVGEKYGTIGAALDEGLIEVTTYRSEERYEPGSRKPIVEFGKTLDEDLGRRDFTMNSMALNPLSGDLIDPFGGLEDAERRLVRAVGDPRLRFAEDPLRLLRAVRFASRFECAIERETWNAIHGSANGLRLISRERIRDEYSRILTGRTPSRALAALRDSGLMLASVPELLELTHMQDHGPRHPLSLWDHEMRVVDAVPGALGLRWAALLHDIAKPRTRTHEPDGRPRFFHHDEEGAGMAREILAGLRYPKAFIEDVVTLIETHMQLHAYSDEWSDGAVRRLMMRLASQLPDAIALARADAESHAEMRTSDSGPKFDALEHRIEDLGRESTSRLRSPLSGDDLMQRYERPPGVWIAKIKNELEEEVVEGRLSPDDRDMAWSIADSLIERL
jgi:poly(A) polymerase